MKQPFVYAVFAAAEPTRSRAANRVRETLDVFRDIEEFHNRYRKQAA